MDGYVAELQGIVADLKLRLTAKTESEKSLAEELQKAGATSEESIKALQAKIASLQDETDQKTAQMASLQGNEGKLKTELSTRKAEFLALQSDLSTINSKIALLADLEQNNNNLKSLLEQKAPFEEKWTEANSQLDATKAELQSLKSQVENSNGEVIALKIEVESMRQLNDSLKGKLSEMESNSSSSSDIVAKKEEAIKSLRQELDEVQLALALKHHLDNDLNELKSAHLRVSDDLKTSQHELSETMGELEAIKHHAADLERSKSQLEDKVGDLKSKLLEKEDSVLCPSFFSV